MATTPTEATGQPRPSFPKRTRSTGPGAVMELPLYRLHLMQVISHDKSWPLLEGVVAFLLTAMSLLAFLGLRCEAPY